MKPSPPSPAGREGLRVAMIGLGCAKNLVDGEVMLGRLREAGLEVVTDTSAADVVIVNTCGFIVDAKKESIGAILEVARAKSEGRVGRLVVAGCMAQAYAEELAREIPEIDGFVGLDQLEEVVGAVSGAGSGRRPDQRAAVALYDSSQPRLVSTPGFAYLKVAEGCDNPCAFCHIPAMRGRFRSRPPEDLVVEARRLEAGGARELVLVAQDTTRYGEDRGLGRDGLRRLVEQLVEHTSVPWIRFLYAHPATLDPGLLDLMGAEPRLVPYLDIPFQHVSRKVLRAMRRGGDAAAFRRLVDHARGRVPELAVRTTMMVGHPGEGEEELEELLEFVAAVRFDHLGVFCYSWQEENPGSELGDPVPETEKSRRRDAVMELQHDISWDRNRELVGRVMPAIIAGPAEESELVGTARLQRHAPEIDGHVVLEDGLALTPGSLVEVALSEAHPYDLVGRVERVVAPAPPGAAELPVMV